MLSDDSLKLYVAIDLFCLFLLFTVLYKLIRSYGKTRDQIRFLCAIIAITVFVALDMNWGIMVNEHVNPPLPIVYTFDILYYMAGSIAAYMWFYFSEHKQRSTLLCSRRRFIISLIPLFVVLILALSTADTHWFFYFDEKLHYYRGTFYLLHPIITLSYILFTCIKAFILTLSKKNFERRNVLLTIGLFGIPPLIAGVLQIFVVPVPAVCIGITLSVVLVYINSQELKISIDALTGINNRNQMINYLSSRMRHIDDRRRLYLLIIDADYFKNINDSYGHTEGDQALKRIASVLRHISSQRNCFVSRYGGDEFILIHEVDSEDAIKAICNQIHDDLDTRNKLANAPYDLKVSIGYAQYNDSIIHMQDFIEAADRELYKVKHSR